MKTLILASAAVLSLGIGSAFAATANTTQPDQPRVAMNAQNSGAQGTSYYGQQANNQGNDAHRSNGYIGGYEPPPPNSMWGGD